MKAQPRKIEDLYGLKLPWWKTTPHELLRTHHPDLNLVAMPNVSSALQALATDEVDAVVGDLASSVWSLRQLKLDGLYVSGETPIATNWPWACPATTKCWSASGQSSGRHEPAKSAIQEHWVGNVLDHRTFWSDLLSTACRVTAADPCWPW
jgi:hypothetical protein